MLLLLTVGSTFLTGIASGSSALFRGSAAHTGIAPWSTLFWDIRDNTGQRGRSKNTVRTLTATPIAF